VCGRGHEGLQLMRISLGRRRACERTNGLCRLICLVGVGGGVSGCGTDPVVCTDEFVAVTAAVVNGTGQALTGLRVHDTVVRTGAIVDITAQTPPGDLPAEGLPAVPIFTDAFKNAIRPAGDAVSVVVSAGDHSASARYEFGTDGCHVQKLAGPDTLVVE
jgi:hypothetical protein